MRAVAKAHHQTGAPITVHTHPRSRTGLVVKRVMCDEEGVDASRIVLGHSGDSTDADHLSELAEAGFVLGMDRFGLDVILPMQERAGIVIELCRRGFASQLVLSHDAACYIDWIDPAAIALMPSWNYLHLQQDVLPYLLEHGVSDEHLDAMLVANPRRYFES
jgi:phosphotriesterase-related protein